MPYSTQDSLVVPHQSTDRAQRCLTSQFGWDAVLSPWYDRMTRQMLVGQYHIATQNPGVYNNKKFRGGRFELPTNGSLRAALYSPLLYR